MKMFTRVIDGTKSFFTKLKLALFYDYTSEDEGNLTQTFGLTLLAGGMMMFQVILKYTFSAVLSIITPPLFFVMAIIGKKIKFFDDLATRIAEKWYEVVLNMTAFELVQHITSSIVTWFVLWVLAYFAQGMKYVGVFWDYHYAFSILYSVSQIVNFASVLFFQSIEAGEKDSREDVRPMQRTTTGYQSTITKDSGVGKLPPPRIGGDLPRTSFSSDKDRGNLPPREQKPKEQPKEEHKEHKEHKVSEEKDTNFSFSNVSTNDVGDRFYDKFVSNIKAGDNVSVSLTYGLNKKGFSTTFVDNFTLGSGDLTSLERKIIEMAKSTVPDDTGVSIYDRHNGNVYLELKSGGFIRVTLKEGLNILGGV